MGYDSESAEARARRLREEARDDAIVGDAARRQGELMAGSKRPLFRFRRRTRMPYKARVVLFAALLGAAMLAYTIGFCLGWPAIAALNDWTDSVVDGAIHAVCATAASITGGDWSGRELALYRLFTLGPSSYIIVASVLSLTASGIVALVWSHIATKRSEDDGTANFLVEGERRGMGSRAGAKAGEGSIDDGAEQVREA